MSRGANSGVGCLQLVLAFSHRVNRARAMSRMRVYGREVIHAVRGAAREVHGTSTEVSTGGGTQGHAQHEAVAAPGEMIAKPT